MSVRTRRTHLAATATATVVAALLFSACAAQGHPGVHPAHQTHPHKRTSVSNVAHHAAHGLPLG